MKGVIVLPIKVISVLRAALDSLKSLLFGCCSHCVFIAVAKGHWGPQCDTRRTVLTSGHYWVNIRMSRSPLKYEQNHVPGTPLK